ncbi:hypothetical protein PSAR109036_01960 [Psychrobacter arenosus]|uniref:hypothetical protein n=1 Tax=Psychrobacter arenosus TaxID=256326 RepID=UPI00191B5247|nr:hypothetical protein [Psychrobacter arenosus]
MDFVKNLFAAIGLMALLMLAMSMASAGIDRIGESFDRYENGQSGLIETHKLDVSHDGHVDQYHYSK